MMAPHTSAKIGQGIMSNLRIFLDTVEQYGVFEYDTQAGYLVRYATEDGVVKFIKIVNGKSVLERVEGIVEVMWRDYPR